MYDYLIVGSGLFGSVFAHEMTERGRKCLVIEKRNIQEGLFTVRRKRVFVFINTGHISSTHQASASGNM